MKKIIVYILLSLFISNLYADTNILSTKKLYNHEKEYTFEFLKDFFPINAFKFSEQKISFYINNELLATGILHLESNQTSISQNEYIRTINYKPFKLDIKTNKEELKGVIKTIFKEMKLINEKNYIIFKKEKNILFYYKDKNKKDIDTFTYFGKKNFDSMEINGAKHLTALYKINNNLCFQHTETDKDSSFIDYTCNDEDTQKLMPIIGTMHIDANTIFKTVVTINSTEMKKYKNDSLNEIINKYNMKLEVKGKGSSEYSFDYRCNNISRELSISNLRLTTYYSKPFQLKGNLIPDSVRDIDYLSTEKPLDIEKALALTCQSLEKTIPIQIQALQNR